METVLLVAERARYDEMKKLLSPGAYAFLRAENMKEARMKILDSQLSFVIVDAMLPGTLSKEISVFAAMQDADVILIVAEDIVRHVATMMRKYGVYTAAANKESVFTALNSIRVARERIAKAEEKNLKLLARLRNEKMLTEAKCLLAGKRNMSEQEAHSYIEKKAMDCRISLTDAALSVIRELS